MHFYRLVLKAKGVLPVSYRRSKKIPNTPFLRVTNGPVLCGSIRLKEGIPGFLRSRTCSHSPQSLGPCYLAFQRRRGAGEGETKRGRGTVFTRINFIA